jgi:hypothetical protein
MQEPLPVCMRPLLENMRPKDIDRLSDPVELASLMQVPQVPMLFLVRLFRSPSPRNAACVSCSRRYGKPCAHHETLPFQLIAGFIGQHFCDCNLQTDDDHHRLVSC